MHTTGDTILYIDDEPNNLIVFKNAFFRQYRVLTAESGEEGLRLMESNDVQLLITDQKMPGMSGVEVLAKTAELYPDTIRIIITA